MGKNKPHHILVIRLSAMGDVAMTVPVLIAFTTTYPELKVTILTKDFLKPIFLKIPNVTVYAADVKGKHKGVLGLYHLFKELKNIKVDAVADLHNVLRSTILKIFFKSVGIPVFQINKGRKEKSALTTTNKKVFKQLKTTHQRYADVFEKLGYLIDLSKVSLLSRLPLNANVKKIIGEKTEKWIGIAPFAAYEGKMYPLYLMEKIIAQLLKSGENKILLFGGGVKEIKILNGIQNRLNGKVTSIAGELSFTEELAVISNLDVMLSMDSGNGHLAANYGIPVITLWGVTHPYAGFAPFGQPIEHAILSDRESYPLIPTSVYGNKVPAGYNDVMKTILPDDVVQKILEVIK